MESPSSLFEKCLNYTLSQSNEMVRRLAKVQNDASIELENIRVHQTMDGPKIQDITNSSSSVIQDAKETVHLIEELLKEVKSIDDDVRSQSEGTISFLYDCIWYAEQSVKELFEVYMA